MLSGRADTTFPPLRYEGTSRLAAANRALARVPAAVWLVGLVAVSALFRFWIARSSPTPWIVPDEYVNIDLSRSLAESGRFAVNGAGIAPWSYGPLYALLIAPAWLLTSSATGAYAAIQLINCVVMSSAAVFAYLLGRRVLDRQLSFFLAMSSVLVPSMFYSSKAMTESLAYPVFLAVVLAIVVALEHPTRSTQLVALAGIGLAVLSRAEMVMLAPAYLTAIAFVTVFEGEGRWPSRARFAPFRLTLYTSVALFASAIAWSLARGGDALGAHGRWLHRFELAKLPRWLLIYLGDLDLYVAALPFAAFIVMLGLACRRETMPRSTRAVLAIAGASFLWFVLLIAVYSTQPRTPPAIHDRYLFYLVPLELLAFLLWIQTGMPRPRRLAAFAAATALLVPTAIPFGEVLNSRSWGASSSTVALVPWGLLRPVLGAHAELLAVILALCGLAVAAFLFVPRRSASLLRIAVVLNFLFIMLFLLPANQVLSERAATRWGPSQPGWIDRAVGTPDARVVAIWTVREDGSVLTKDWWAVMLANQIENEKLVRVYALEGAADQIDAGWFVGRATRDSDGRLVENGEPIQARYVLASDDLAIAGTVVARDPKSGLRLLRIDGPLRLRRTGS
jgi:dolichyl-phosphate-mannose-protein mannosyltransferase